MRRISIIVPAYNSSRTISPLLKSLLSQTFMDFEVIFIDDGSTDSTVDMIQETLDKVAPFEWRVIKIKHSGPGIARNVGIKKATGDAIYFLDSDDTITPNAIATLHHLLSDTKADVVVCSSEVNTHDITGRASMVGMFHGVDVLAEYLSGKLNIFMGNILITRRILLENNIQFPPLKHGEDIVFISEVLSRTNKVYITPDPLHRYLDNPDSLSSYRHASLAMLKEYKNALTSIAAMIEDDGYILKILQHRRIPRGILSVLLQLRKGNKQLYNEILDNYGEIRWYLSLCQLGIGTFIEWLLSRILLYKKLRDFVDILYVVNRFRKSL